MDSLHRLLAEARGELPPTTVDLDRIAARGRRTIRRRRWSAGAAAVAVTLAAGSLFPLVRGHRRPSPPAPAASAGAGFTTRLTGYATGGYQVGASVVATPGYEVAPISRGARVVGSVEVYRPGAFDPRVFRAGTPVAVGPAAGFLHTATTTIRYGSGGDQKLATLTRNAVAWPYADQAWAVVRSSADAPADDLSAATLQELASHLVLGPAVPVRLPFRLGHLPAGLSVQAAGRAGLDSARDAAPGRLGEVTLAPPGSFTGLTGPVAPGAVTIVEERQPAGVHHGATACDADGCYRGVPGSGYYLGVTGKLPATELRGVLDGLTTADPGDPATWFPARG